MLARILIITGLVSAGLLLILITTSTPATAGAFGILAIFLLGYTVTLSLLTFFIWATAKLVNKIGHEIHVLRKSYVVSLKKSYYYSSIIALGPVLIISLQSVGGIGIYELSLVGIFILLGCIYVARRTA